MSRARDLSKLGNPNVIVADTERVGFGTQVPENPANAASSLISAGIVTATAYYGDGSNLEGVASAGLGTAVDDTKDSIGQNIYFTNAELSINENTTVNAPDTSSIAYTQYQQVTVESGSELIIADGDSFIPDVLGIGTALQASTAGAGNGLFGTVYADNIENVAGRGGPNFPLGITVAGVSTLGGNVSIGGTLTYEDVTNVDSIGIVTARNGIDITGGNLNAASNLILKTDGSEKVRITSVGNLLVGTDTARTEVGGMGNPQVQVEGTSASSANLSIARNSDNSAGGYLTFAKSRGTSDGSNVIVQNGDTLGNIIFASSDGADVNQYSARIRGKLEGTPGANDVPGCLTFETTADGQTASTERLRIGPAGQFGIGGSNYGTSGQVLTSGGASAAPSWAEAGGGAWEVVSTHVLSGSTSDLQLYGWSNNYAQYKLVFTDCYDAGDNLMRIRFYQDATSGQNGTLVTGSSYSRVGTKTTYGTPGGTGVDGGSDSYFYPQITDHGTEINTGELIFPMKTSSYSDANKCYGEWLGHSHQWRGISCKCNADPTHFLTGIHIYFTENNSTTARAPSTGRITLLRMKYS